MKRKAELFEEVDDTLKIQSENNTTLEIKNLNKIYKNKKHAVRGVDLTMYSDQIFALLGHNGAGKTTTISMVSGLIPITAGKIKIMGFDSQLEGDKITNIMGVCPQTNPIYPRLSCYEHLVLYSKIKTPNKSPADREEEIETILKDIDLFDKKNFPAGNLSGGQKRKLCVACAFIGGSKVILLDEPTSGLDVSARRHLWNMLKKYKKDKIIILTTHFMDEADYLGDRIGVMGDGKLLTCGSSLFLKSKFGFGYSLTMVKANSAVSTRKVTEVVKQHVTGAKLEGDISKELKYVLPTAELAKFEGLFQALET
jgi:ATP-binding cassette subfamily A (ABC1) protein 3